MNETTRTSVDGKTTREPFSGIFVHPITEQHNMGGQIEIVQIRIGILRWCLTDNNGTIQTVHFLETSVSVPEVGTSITSCPLVSGQKIRICLFK